MTANIIGETIREEIAARGWTVTELSRRSIIDVSVLDRILNGSESVTETTSRLLGRAFGISRGCYLRLQNGRHEQCT